MSLRLIQGDSLSAGTAQTGGMIRSAAISGDLTGASALWMGRTVVLPGASSGDHHHGVSETGIFVVSGHPVFVFRDPFSDLAPHLVALSVAPISETRDTAKVLAEFARGDGARERLTYAMLFERDEWRIDDIIYSTLDGESHTLRGMLAAN